MYGAIVARRFGHGLYTFRGVYLSGQRCEVLLRFNSKACGRGP